MPKFGGYAFMSHTVAVTNEAPEFKEGATRPITLKLNPRVLLGQRLVSENGLKRAPKIFCPSKGTLAGIAHPGARLRLRRRPRRHEAHLAKNLGHRDMRQDVVSHERNQKRRKGFFVGPDAASPPAAFDAL